MTKLSAGFCIALLGAFAACGPQNEADNGSTEKVASEATVDTILQDEAPAEQREDTTLQVLEEATLRVLGNTKEEIRFEQDTLELKTGASVNLQLINEGTEQSMIHNLVITTKGKSRAVAQAGASVGASGNYIPESADVIASSPLALPGQTVQIKFTTPTEPVTYDFTCTYPDHRHETIGKIIVR